MVGLARCSAALRLPTLGYTVDSFAPAQLIRRISRPAPPSELPCGSLSRPFPKVSIRPSGCLRQATQPAPAGMCSPLRSGCLVRSRSSRPSGCLRQATQPAPAGMCSR